MVMVCSSCEGSICWWWMSGKPPKACDFPHSRVCQLFKWTSTISTETRAQANLMARLTNREAERGEKKEMCSLHPTWKEIRAMVPVNYDWECQGWISIIGCFFSCGHWRLMFVGLIFFMETNRLYNNAYI